MHRLLQQIEMCRWSLTRFVLANQEKTTYKLRALYDRSLSSALGVVAKVQPAPYDSLASSLLAGSSTHGCLPTYTSPNLYAFRPQCGGILTAHCLLRLMDPGLFRLLPGASAVSDVDAYLLLLGHRKCNTVQEKSIWEMRNTDATLLRTPLPLTPVCSFVSRA